MRALKISLLVTITVALGFAVFYAVTRVGDLNGQAAILQACMDQPAHAAGCPSNPISAGQISNLHDEADTIGKLGWVCFLVLFFGIGGTVFEILTD